MSQVGAGRWSGACARRSPLMDLTRIVRSTENVRVLPSALWTTPATRPRTKQVPVLLAEVQRGEGAGDVAAVAVVPTMREASEPAGVCAIGRATEVAARGRRGRLRGGREAGGGGDHGEAENARDDERGQTAQRGSIGCDDMGVSLPRNEPALPDRHRRVPVRST